jgi:hypothetical protein
VPVVKFPGLRRLRGDRAITANEQGARFAYQRPHAAISLGTINALRRNRKPRQAVESKRSAEPLGQSKNGEKIASKGEQAGPFPNIMAIGTWLVRLMGLMIIVQ